MPKLIVLYPLPADSTIFERRFRLEHTPIVLEKIPGLKKFVASQVLGAPTGTAPYQLVAELYFDSLESLQAAMASGGGQATVAHAMEISTGGPPVVLIAEDESLFRKRPWSEGKTGPKNGPALARPPRSAECVPKRELVRGWEEEAR